MKIKIANIEQDVSIQCRTNIDMQVVEDYAEAMGDGADFPPVELFGTKERCWIGDGWHRIKAAEQVGFADIPANLHPGGRVEALRCALSANAINGLRRKREDIKRCIEIAVREFPNLSQNMIAEMVGCSQGYISQLITTNKLDRPEKTIGKDGKQRRAKGKKQPKEPAQEPDEPEDEPEITEEEEPKKEEPNLSIRRSRVNRDRVAAVIQK